MTKEILEQRNRQIKSLDRQVGQDAMWKKNLLQLMNDFNRDQFMLLEAYGRLRKELQELKRETV